MVKRLFLAVSCSFRFPAFFGLVPLPLLDGLSFLGFVWYLGLYCYLLGRFFPSFGCFYIYIDSMQLLFLFYYVSLDVFASRVWATFAGLRDPSLRELASRLASTVIASRATGTTDAYRRAFLRWRGFAASSDEIQAFPARPEHVALYLQHVLDTTKSRSSVDSAIYGIQWAHNLADVPSPTNSPIVHAISRASKRIIGTRVTNKKEPISPDMIRNLVNISNLDNLLELRNVCIFLLAYARFFRIEEVLHFKYGDISFHSGYVVINLEVSKTDQLRKGNQVVIAESSNDDTCPVKIFKRYLSHLESSPVDPSHYVFRALSKTRSGHTLVSINKPISYSSVRDYFKSTFKDIEPDITLFSTHSLRAGGASAAANAGVADRLFQRHGRWKSVSAKNGYVEDS